MGTRVYLTFAGVVAGLLGGAAVDGLEGLILGGSAGLVAGVLFWTIAGSIERIRHEQRINRYFTREYRD